jgi:hypothetical protein
VEVKVVGEATFTINGTAVSLDSGLTLPDGKSVPAIQVPKWQWHQAIAGKSEAMFLRSQLWNQPFETSLIALNWTGAAFSEIQSGKSEDAQSQNQCGGSK